MYHTPRLIGKRCLITGGSRGIGLAIADLFAAHGASCTLVGRDQAALDRAVAGLKSRATPAPAPAPGSEEGSSPPPPSPPPQSPSKLHSTIAMDVSNPGMWGDLASRMRNEKVDVLVNAAGVTQGSLLYRTTTSDIRQVLDTNLLGTTLGCRALIPKMTKQRGGCIINVASLLATHGGRGASVYAASKAGIVGLTRSLAWEVGRFGIRANVLLPGYIDTDMTKGLVEEVADAALFLAENTYAHNCVLNIDGGLSGT
ncbi:hypothetical protein SLS62_002856 [Diatrype stigma]|uniref:Uncharacterized protein n=1 Tax=Diatrype stigma TaxID=117547 RepID=A0AAN9UWW4_9PEZI